MNLDELILFDDAVDLTLDAARRLLERQSVRTREADLWETRGRVLASDVRADRDLPPFTRSAMDGFAVRSEDVRGGESRLEVIGEVVEVTSDRDKPLFSVLTIEPVADVDTMHSVYVYDPDSGE